MTDLISRQAAILAIRRTAEPFYRGEDNVIPAEYEDAIMELPTVDAVPMVRCKDCKYRPIDTGTHQYGHELEFPNEYKCPCQCGDNWYSWMPDDEWFCANGERRTNG